MSPHDQALAELRRQARGLPTVAEGACAAIAASDSYRSAREALSAVRDTIDRILEAGTEALLEARTHESARRRASEERRAT